jgi:hypothetical protein
MPGSPGDIDFGEFFAENAGVIGDALRTSLAMHK